MRIYAYSAILIALLGSYYGVYRLGASGVEAKDREALLEAHIRENQAITEVQNAKAKRDIVYRDRIKIVSQARDDSGCLDRITEPELTDQLYAGYHSQ